jgi:hypothetical protein
MARGHKGNPYGPTLNFDTLLVAAYEDDIRPFLLGLFLFYFSCGALPAALLSCGKYPSVWAATECLLILCKPCVLKFINISGVEIRGFYLLTGFLA